MSVDLLDIFGDDLPAATPSVPPEKENLSREFKEDFLEWLVNGKTEPPRKPGLHASSLWKTCARVPLLEKKYAQYIVIEPITAGQRMTYDEGHTLHDLIQNTYLNDFGRLWGNWVCLSCSPDAKGEPVIVHQGTLPRACPVCKTAWQYADGTKNIVYAEMSIEDPVLMYCGHCDGIVLSRHGRHVLFEFKTISPSQYRGLKCPKSEHVVQAHAYMHVLGHKDALIAYWDKGSQADWRKMDGRWFSSNPHLKVFHIKFDDALWAKMVERIENYHAANKIAKELPTVEAEDVNKFRRVCTHKRCDLAGECHVRDLCFAI